MKHLINSIVLVFFIITMGAHAMAQEYKVDDNVIYIDVPKKLNIKDKIFLVNSSPYSVLQAVVVLCEDGNMTPVGNISYLNAGAKGEMASYGDNWLKNLRGKTIGIKIKGVKKLLGDTSSTGVNGSSISTGGFGSFGVGVQHTELKADEINNINPEDITYDFNIRLSEDHHDLYITIYTGSNAFDF